MIEIEGLSFSYGRERLFENLSLRVRPGNIYGLLGRNGAGKTTLLKIISGLLSPDGGHCSTLGHNPRRRLPETLSQIFYLPEEFYLPSVIPDTYRRLHAPFYPAFDRSLFERYVREFELPPDQRVTSYSYGQKKKFLLAFGLSTQARLLLLDEPTNGLDIPSKSQFRRLVASALADDRTFLISTHQVRDMEHLIDPVIILEDGRIVFNHTLDEVSRKVRISLQKSEPEPEEAIYVERVLGGYSVVSRGSGGEETSIDLETLFNMVTTAGNRIEPLLEDANEGERE